MGSAADEMRRGLHKIDIDEYFRGRSKDKFVLSAKTMGNVVKAEEEVDWDEREVFRGLKIAHRQARKFYYDDDFTTLMELYLALCREFQEKESTNTIPLIARQIESMISHQASWANTRQMINTLAERGESILDETNPSSKLAETFVDSVLQE